MPDDYQAVLSVFIFLLCLNLLFWLIIALWRFCTLTRFLSFNRIAARFHRIRYYLQRRFHFRRRVTRITNLNNLNGISNRNLDLNSDLPPTYEEALKLPHVPCVSTICSQISMNNSTILNIDNLNELNSLNLLNQLDNQNRSNFLLCSGNCNCINHLRQSISDDHSTQLPESSSTATTSTLNTITTILDQNPNTNRNLIVETNLTTFSNKSNLYNESIQNEQKNELNNQQNLEIRNSQINRSSTFNDLQSYIKNSLNFQNNR